ncbi:MAG: esterase-like activity of phytase family protein [Candidatus Sericytochromatia bacterium]
MSQAVTVEAAAVPLDPQNPTAAAIGGFSYAGGLVLSSRQTDLLHGLSDIEITGQDKLMAVGDMGIFFEARLRFDAAHHLVGLADTRITPMMGEDGLRLINKEVADAEGLALLANGDRLVSFERRKRILRFPADGSLPQPVPAPGDSLAANAGIEALSLAPESGSDAYLVGAEGSGETWICRLSASCSKESLVAKAPEYGLVSAKRLPGNLTGYLLRTYDPLTGTNHILLQIFKGEAKIDQLALGPPYTVDNFEGLAAVAQPDGSLRFYLISDDNKHDTQRTLLLAFDWKAP